MRAEIFFILDVRAIISHTHGTVGKFDFHRDFQFKDSLPGGGKNAALFFF